MMKQKHSRVRQPKIGTKMMRLVILAVFVIFIIVADIFLLVDHGKSFSSNENRVLQQAPALTYNSLTSGSFMTQEEDFVSDQFFLRDGWISLKLFLDRISGKAESNDVYLGKNGYLLEKPVEPDDEYLQRNIAAINAFAESTDADVVMTLVPGAACVCDQLLPNQAPVLDVSAIIDNIKGSLNDSVNFVDVTDTLKEHKTEGIYYKSDHHWKSLGALYAFETMTGALGIEDPVNEYAVMTVTYDFAGTMASNSGATYVKDSIEIYVPVVSDTEDTGSEGIVLVSDSTAADTALSSTLEYVVEYTDTAEKYATMYYSAALDEKDKYQVFMGGNHPLVNIQTNKDNGENLLILKDSYANTFVQFLLPYYNKIVIVDPRYYSDDLSKLINDNGITDVLILYSENNFVTDNSLFGVLEDAVEE